MSSLWTPDGERQVPPPSDEGAPGGATAAGGANGSADGVASDALREAAQQLGVDLDSMSREDVEQLRSEMAEMMRVRREMARTPASDMVANHLMRLFDLAMIYLEAEPPAFDDAATVIESFRAVVDGVGGRLGAHEAVLNEALSQMQMVFVQVKQHSDASAD